MTIAFPVAGRKTFLRVPETNGRSPTYLILPWVNQTDTNLQRSGNFLDSKIVIRSKVAIIAIVASSVSLSKMYFGWCRYKLKITQYEKKCVLYIK